MNTYKIGTSDTRPWGTWEVIAIGDHYAVKRIVVNAGGILSLQRHAHRSEIWTIVEGSARVTIGEKIKVVPQNKTIEIPVGTWHRIENPGATPLTFIEIQYGDNLDEADIERKSDKYGRV